MTATPADLTNAEKLQPEDIAPGTVLHKRLTSSKPTKLVSVEVKKIERKEDRRVKVIQSIVDEARKQKGEVIAAICNRVAVARGVFEQLNKSVDSKAILLTGQVRPHERDQLLRDYQPTIMAGREADPDERIYVVATQCIEVGADLDFDAMVTECAPIDTLKQRFGRLNRMGRDIEAHAVIVSRDDHRKWDPLYKKAIGETWRLLNSLKQGLDFGVLKSPDATDDSQRSPRPDYRKLLPTDVEQAADVNLPLSWSLSSVLHDGDTSTDVSVCWRDDLGEFANKSNIKKYAVLNKCV